MKVVHINRQKINQDLERRQAAEALGTRLQRRARGWVRRKYAALLQEKPRTG